MVEQRSDVLEANPRARGMLVVLLGSAFGVYVFLSTPTDGQYYVFGLTVMLLSFLVSSSYLAFDWLK